MKKNFHKYLEMAEVHTTTVQVPGGMGIKYWNTIVIQVLDDGGYVLDSGGYRTSTTKKRINKYLHREFSVIQKNYDWFVRTPKGDFPFKDGMYISADGQVSAKQPPIKKELPEPEKKTEEPK